MKKIISLMLSLIIILGMFSMVPFTVSAESDFVETPEEEYIYYSDLFYGYSTYLPQSYYLLNYSNETQQAFNKIYSDYMDSPMFVFSDIKHSLPLVFNVKEYTKLISDLTGLTSFTYENALDKANIKFAEELMGESTIAKTYGTENKWVKNINKFLKVYDTFEKNYVVYEKTEIQIYEETFEYFVDNGAFSSISVTNIEALKEIVLPKISEITKILSTGSNVLKGAQTLMLGLMIEDVRACIIDEVLGSQQKNTTLYDGMSRLKKQLSNGFVSYFYYNYIEKQLLGKVADFVVKELTNDTIFVDGGFKLIGAIVDVACYVVFDVIFDVPDIDDLTTQAVLTQYSNDFFYLVRNKASDFLTQFDNEDISDYETLFTAYQAATNAAFESSDKITLSSNSEEFNSVKSKYYKKDIYSNYIDNVKEFIKGVPRENRKITNHGEWIIKSNTLFSDGSDTIEDGKIYLVDGCFNAEIKIYHAHKLTIPENTDVTINGNITYEWANSAKLVNNGDLTVNGNIDSVSSITNSGKLEVLGSIKAYHYYMSNSNASLILIGDLNLTDQAVKDITAGSVILNGIEQQTITNLKSPTIIVENESEEGIIFNSSISPSLLFDHKGNNFTLYNNGSGSTFVDYDGDGLKDNVDPEPTVGNPCVITVKSEDTLQGSVSINTIDTIGGTKHTITATPTFKYHFVKWVNSAGKTVSTTAEYTFVAKADETFIAVFEKRSQNITVNTNGGVITVPSSAVIESEVSVSFTENEGYIYTDGSLKYNGITIEDGKFTMPDEPVTITAEFVYNEHYFALKEKIREASAIKFNDYTALSYENLQAAIANANSVLENHITQAVSEQHIEALQNAIDNLKNKYIVSISIEYSPTLYIGVESLIDELDVLITYDNGTTAYATEFTVGGFDCWQLGDQEITVYYGDFSANTVVTVYLRELYEVSYEEITDQLFLGEGTYYEPKPVITYPLTNEVLVENVDYVLYYYDNYAPGKAMIDVMGIGNYEGYISMEFIIYCEHNYEVAEYIAPTCTENGYRKEICSICNDVKDRYYTYVFTENLPESKHNYANNTNITYTYQAEGAEYLDLLFSSSTKVQSNKDYIYIYDANGTQTGKYTGTALASQTIRVTGDTVKIKITSNSSTTYYGFSLDSITATYPYTELKATGHTVEDWIVVKEPTIYEEGLKQQICSVCSEVVNEETIAKLIYFGDANHDGKINSLDLTNLTIALLSNDTSNLACDANEDGKIDIRDLVCLKKKLAEIIA